MPVGIQILLALLAGVGLGIFIGWLLWRGARSDLRLEKELRQQIGLRESELDKLRGQFSEASNARAAAEAKQGAAEKLLAEQRELQEKALADLREAFQAMSAEALKQSAPEFLRLAEQSFGKFQETAKGDLAQRQEAIKGLVEPLKQQLETYQKNLQQSSTAQSSALGEVKKHLETLAQSNQSLAQETQQFRLVLHSNQARGRWGEETLRRVVEAAGMSAHCDCRATDSSSWMPKCRILIFSTRWRQRNR
jgi:DNA recombination protein RmuC